MIWNTMKKQFDKSIDNDSALPEVDTLSDDVCNSALQALHESSRHCIETALFLKQDGCSYVKSGTLFR